MIRIVKLSLKNFKSFKKADIPFAHGFTVIAGSNGSGKSNILDALMFSLGITSLKALRASRLTDLVNATAEENYAKVDLEIEHKDQSLVVSRMVDRTGKGVYRLNDDRKTLNEISSLLNELGISANGHNIVVQGDITRVINMGPEERRGIVDEAAGIREFDEKKAEALKELGRVDEKIRDVRIVLNEREAYLKELEAERQAALEHEALEDERTRTRATLLFLALESAKQKLQALSEKRAEKQGQKNALLSEQEQAKARIASLKGELAELHANLLSHSEKMFSQFGSKLEAQRGELRLADERLRTIAESIARNEAEQSAAERERGTLQTQLKEREAEMKTGTMDLPRLIAETDQLTAEKKGFEKHAQTEESRLDELAKERETLEIQLRTLSEQKWAHASKIEELERAYARALSERKSIEKDRVLVVERRDFAKAAFERIAQITTEFRSPEKALEEAQTRHAKALQAHEEAVARIRDGERIISAGLIERGKRQLVAAVIDVKQKVMVAALHIDRLEQKEISPETHLAFRSGRGKLEIDDAAVRGMARIDLDPQFAAEPLIRS